jgi:hypothetical protein
VLHGIVENKSMDYTMGMSQAETMYFSAFCSQLGRPVLLGDSNVVGVDDGPMGPELHYQCHCGEPGVIYPKLPTVPPSSRHRVTPPEEATL